MDRAEIESTVITIAEKAMREQADGWTMETRWEEDLHARSPHVMKTLALVKIRGKVDITPDELAACKTLGDLADFIEQHQ